ncbi:MAG: STAS domain-containing protein [Oscillospiraceae bacterium]|nr:STAS domain-containing protein [Oscillospiraceae bacterium]
MDKDLLFNVDYIEKDNNMLCKVILKGKITSAGSYLLQHGLEAEIRGGQKHFILNMRNIEFLSSAGIRVLLDFHRRAMESGGGFFIEQPSESVANVLGMTALDDMLFRK